MTRSYWNIRESFPLLQERIRQGWGLARLYRWLQPLYPHHGDSVVFGVIIGEAERQGKPFAPRTIRRVIRTHPGAFTYRSFSPQNQASKAQTQAEAGQSTSETISPEIFTGRSI